MNEIDYGITRDYFYPSSAGKILGWSLVLGVVFFCVFINDNNLIMFLIFAVICIIIATASVWRLSTKANINNIAHEIQKIRNTIKQKAIDELGIDIEECQEIDPVILEFKEYSADYFSDFVYKPEDDMPSNYRFMVLFFSENQMYYYDYICSLLNDENSFNTGEYFYRDIVAFNTQHKKEEFTYNGQRYSKQYQIFRLKTTGGEAFTTYINRDDERSIQGMRQLLREKKKALM